MDSNENCGRNSTWKIPAAYGPVLRKMSKRHNFAIFGRSPKSHSLYDYGTLYKVWMNQMEITRGAVLKIVKLEMFQSAPNDPKLNSKNRTSQVPSSICAL